VHLDLDLPVAAADLAAPALDVEREAARLVAAGTRLLGLGEEVADLVAGLDRGVRPIGDWSTLMILSRCSSPRMRLWLPGRMRARCSLFETAL
jgi:hypothetical protein